MEGRGGSERWCMLRCAGGAHDNNKTVIDRIMLGFRRIAPKPLKGGIASCNLLGDNKNLLISSKRSKRKYVRVGKNNGCRRKMATLQLLPEKEKVDSEDSTRRSESWCNEKLVSKKNYGEQVTWLGFGVVESWVTVESVTGACMEGSEDVEIMKNLEKDTCPGFISDGEVKWVNDAYKKMVMGLLGSEESNVNGKLLKTVVMVSLVMKEKLPCMFNWLTCRVRVQYTWQEEKYSKMVPCDVWRMGSCGGLAWRLDVDAALSLGR